ncbi:hypothetical protein KIL84_005999 [Mauremys mutica]|uniref:Uncharacterized protein n=1 Tax=Mauremys mutica TaxID=74926 RepID=A0A9D3XE76_9SAUR|nr:hypothetical protein KIL84_005999 [Mauremys mutica]
MCSVVLSITWVHVFYNIIGQPQDGAVTIVLPVLLTECIGNLEECCVVVVVHFFLSSVKWVLSAAVSLMDYNFYRNSCCPHLVPAKVNKITPRFPNLALCFTL